MCIRDRNHDPRRPRKMLVHARQLGKLAVRANEKGMTLVPLQIYFNGRGIVKVSVGVCRGKKLFDKREVQKERDVKRDLDRAMKTRRYKARGDDVLGRGNTNRSVPSDFSQTGRLAPCR